MLWLACCCKIVFIRENSKSVPVLGVLSALLLCYYCKVAKIGVVVVILLNRQLAPTLMLHTFSY